MVKYLIILTTSVLFILPTLLWADFTQGGDIPIQADVARFKASKGFTYLEVYLTFPRDKFERQQVEDKFEAQVEIRVNIVKDDSLISSQTWDTVDKSEPNEQIKSSQQIFDLYATFIKEGKYKLKVIVRDKVGKVAGWAERDFVISPFPTNKLVMSDIQFGYRITPTSEKNKFVKNGHYVFPNPGSIYGKENALMYYYNEIYNLSPLQRDTDSTYSVYISIHDLKGNLVQKLPEKKKQRKGSSLLELGQINISALSAGVYQLAIHVVDEAIPDTALQLRNFLLYSGEPLATTSSSGSSQAKSDAIEFSGSSEKELDELYEKSRYVATKNENKLYKKLDLDGKREFMANFWRNRDSNKSTAVNEFMLEYLQRIAIAEAQFRSGNKEGWRTHRGRVYLTYGEPSEIERFPSSMGEKPYEIWYYHALEGGVQFIFIDLSGFGEYQLVHSTSRNEIQDYGWQSRWLFNQ
jgi:GWxTD domain-containing protein